MDADCDRGRWLKVGMVLWMSLFAAVPAEAQRIEVTQCGSSLPVREGGAYVPLPAGDVFCPLIADPKEPHSFASFLQGSAPVFNTAIGALGIGEHLGLIRWGHVQISLSASIFAQFDVVSESFDLINADYLIGIPLTFRSRGFSARFRIYHQSSHLGDEFLLRPPPVPERENLSFEAVEVILSQEAGPFRVYGGGEYFFNRNPEDLESSLLHGGAEYRQQTPFVRVGDLGSARLVAASDFKFTAEQDWAVSMSLRGGFEVGRVLDPEGQARRWRLLAEYYRGPTPYGQFFRDESEYIGIGMHLTL